MLENRNEVYYLNGSPFTGLAWTPLDGSRVGEFFLDEEFCKYQAKGFDVIPYTFKDGVMTYE